MTHAIRGIAFCFLAACTSYSIGAELTWTGWLGGPERAGWVSGFETPAKWPEELTAKWKVDVGTGYGSPLVTDGFVYQHARQGDDEVVWCVDLESGKTKWRHSHPMPFKMGGGGEWHGKGPKSSPALADGRLFTMSISGVLSAFDAGSGAMLWRRDYGAKFDANTPYWGASTSPLVDGERVIVHFGNDEKGVLVALDAESGTEVWTQGNAGASYSSPLVAEIDGVRQIIEWNHDALVGVESATGNLLWEYPFPHVGNNQNMPTPAFHKGIVFVGGENRGMHAIEPQLNGETWSAKQIWEKDEVALDMSSAIVNGDLLYGFSHYGKGRLFCMRVDSGEILWQSPGRVGSNVMFLSIPDHVVALIDNGELQVIKATGEGYAKAASYRVSDQPTWAPPVLLSDGVLVKDRDTLIRYSFGASAEQ